jgi:hypothetical protein
VKEHQDKKGRPTSQVQVQQPTLAVCILALTDPPRYVDLASGTTPSGATAMDEMNIADLLQHYGHGLAALMRAQFPAQHDPTNASHLLPLPSLARPLFTAQAHVVQSTLKLLGQGEHPLVLGEVGCGKSMISLAVAAALSPTHYPAMRNALRAQGYWHHTHHPRPVRRALVLCPPHLLSSWSEQIRLTLPGAAVVAVRQIADLHRSPPPAKGGGPGSGLTIYLLTRETAKLGHAWRAGLTALGTCPKCGTPTSEAPERIVRKRLRCRHQSLRAVHPAGALAHALARMLLPVDPEDDTLCALVPERYIRRAAGAADTMSDEPEAGATAPEAEGTEARQARWLAQTTHCCDIAKMQYARLIDQLNQIIIHEGSLSGTGWSEPLSALLRAAFLLHLAAPADARTALITRTVQRWTASALDAAPVAAPLREACLRLLLLLAPTNPGIVDQLLPALGSLATHDPFTRTRARLVEEAARAEKVRAEQLMVQEARDQAVRWATTHPGGDWYDFTVPLETGILTWREGGTPIPLGHVAAAFASLAILTQAGRFVPGPPCNEPLYEAVPTPRRVPLARYIARHCRRMFDLVILDEMHEFNNSGSAQEQAAHLLAGLPGVAVLGLTGSLMGGYASSLFANFRAFSPAFRRAFGPHDKGKFVARFGYLKILRTLPDKPGAPEVREYGKASLRAEREEDPLIRVLGEAPGVLPLFLPQYLLPIASIIHKADLEYALPPLREQPLAVTVPAGDTDGQELLRRYAILQQDLLAQIAADRFSPLQGRLLGALTELPSFLDLATADVGNALDQTGCPVYEIRYSANCGEQSNSLVASVPLLDPQTALPKERWLLEQVREQLARGRNVLLYVRHTGNGRLIARYQRLLRQRLGVEAAYLDSTRVDTRGREDWLKREVIGRKRRVLLVNPEAVKTGLNCLTPYFQTAIWLELTYNALTYRQANGRIHRIGSDPATSIEVYVPVYGSTAQETALALVARKVTVSTQMDGLEVESQLEAAGAGEGAENALAVLSIGQALYEILSGQAVAPQHQVPVPQVVSAAATCVSRQPSAPSELPIVAPSTTTRPQQLGLFDASADPTTKRAAKPPTLPIQQRECPRQLSLFDLDEAA